MKYICAEKLNTEIDKIIEGLKKNCNPNPFGTMEECLADSEIEALGLIKDTIDKMAQEQPTPPGIEEEEKKKGWLDYGLTVGEIRLHRYNMQHRIRENRDAVQDIKRRMSPHDLARLTEYSESVGAENILCCLQAWAKDFRFTQEDVREIIRKEDAPC